MKRVTVFLTAVAICTLAAFDASAESNLALNGIALKAGVVNPDNVDLTLGAALVFDLGTIHPKVAFESYAGYWSQTDNAYGSEFGVRDFAFGAKGKYMFSNSNPTVQPYAGAGLGFHVLNAHVETPAAYSGGTLLFPGISASETDLKVGLDLGGGLRIDRGSKFAFIGDAWYTLVSDVSHFSIMVGAEYMFGR